VGRPELIRLASGGSADVQDSAFIGKPSRLREELGWAPRIDLEAGLRHTLAILQPQTRPQ
jgi:hypothetical protein